jgi:ATP-dependent Clp protease, protease subunit
VASGTRWPAPRSSCTRARPVSAAARRTSRSIQADDLRRTRDTVLGLISEDTGQDIATVERDSRRDRWFSADEALQYGFIDHIVDTAGDVLPGPQQPLGLGIRR